MATITVTVAVDRNPAGHSQHSGRDFLAHILKYIGIECNHHYDREHEACQQEEETARFDTVLIHIFF